MNQGMEIVDAACGDGLTYFGRVFAGQVIETQTFRNLGISEAAGIAVRRMSQHGTKPEDMWINTVGIGGALLDLLHNWGFPVQGFVP
jgi:hypothetical protein